jgi:hypothetical protein
MNRPRESVLALFDPLRSDSVDDTDSGSESDPDKENLATAALFSRFQKPAVSLKRRLVDIGDITVEESDLAVVKEEDENESEGENNRFFLSNAAPSSPETSVGGLPRTPLQDLHVDEVTPSLQRGNNPRRRRLHPPARTVTDLSTSILVPPKSSLNSIIDAVHEEGVTFANVKPPAAPHNAFAMDQRPASPPPVKLPTESTLGRSADHLASFYMSIQAQDISCDLIHDEMSFMWKGEGETEPTSMSLSSFFAITF